jgi:hypothetical protein
MKELVLGCIPSKMDGTEKIFSASEKQDLPETYSYKENMSPILDQGNAQICVPCTVSAYLNWKENLKDGSKKDNNVDLYDIYKFRTNRGDGMTFKEALKFLNKNGVKSDAGILKINSYSRVMNSTLLKVALVMNGPCFGALPVYTDYCDFWNENGWGSLRGYHAIAIVGYDEDGFIIRNSWGRSFCDKGYTVIPYNEFNKLIEIWTVID